MFAKDIVGAPYRGVPYLQHCKADIQEYLCLLLVGKDSPCCLREAGAIVALGLLLVILFEAAVSRVVKFC